MANRRFIDFPIASTVGDNDIVLIWQDGANKQTTKATILSGLPENLEDLNDVVISGLTNGQILRYDSVTGKWENTDQGNLDLNDLNDVSIVSPSNGQVLVYNSSTSKWENSSGGFVPYVGAVTTVDLGAQGLRAGYVRFDTSVASVPDEQGLMYWDASRSTAALIMNGTLQHIGQDTFFYVKNSSGSNIPKGTCVRFAGTDGASGHLLIAPFLANGSVPSSYFMGVTAEAIANGAFGQVMHFGELEGINTSGFTAGALLYASTTVAGAFQTTAPVAPNNIVLVAAAINSKNNGAIIVRPQIGSNINNDEGVKITSVANLDLLQYQSGTGLWENKTLAQVIGSAYVPSTRTITINGTTQDLSANRTYNVGTVTSVGLSSATSGVTIGSTPVTTSGTITLAIATASGSQNGLLSSTDWTTFNNKQNALTNPVTGTGASGQVAYFNGTTTITSESNLFWDATNDRLGIGTSSPTDRLTLHRDGATGVYAHWRNNSNANNAYIGITGSGLMQIQNNGNIDFYTGASYNNQMTLAGTGNLIIGNPGSDNGARLQVSGTANITSNGNSVIAFRINDTNANASFLSLNASNVDAAIIANGTSGIPLDFYTGGSARMRITSSGNLGLGVTPSSWGSAYKTLQIAQSSFSGATLYSWVGNNWVDDGSGNKYIANGFSTLYEQRSGEHRFLTAPSGTAGNAISFTQAMTLNASGNLLVGTTSDNGARLQVSGGVTSTGSATNTIGFVSINTTASKTHRAYTDTNGNYIIYDATLDSNRLTIASTGAATFSSSVSTGTLSLSGSTFQSSADFYIGTNNANLIQFYTSNQNRLIITPSGNVGIGTSSPSSLLSVSKSSDSGSGSVFPRLQVENTLATQGNGSSTFNFADIRIATGNGSAEMYLASSFASGTWEPQGLISVATNHPMIFRTNNTERMRITSGGNVLIGTTTDNGARLQVSGNTYSEGLHIATGQFVQGASATNTFYTFSNTSINRVFLITLRQSGSSANNVVAIGFTFGGALGAYNVIQDNTNPVLFLTISASGLGLRLTTGSGYGTTTWDWTITQIK